MKIKQPISAIYPNDERIRIVSKYDIELNEAERAFS